MLSIILRINNCKHINDHHCLNFLFIKAKYPSLLRHNFFKVENILAIPINKTYNYVQRRKVRILFTGLTLPHFCACPNPGSGFQRHVVFLVFKC